MGSCSARRALAAPSRAGVLRAGGGLECGGGGARGAVRPAPTASSATRKERRAQTIPAYARTGRAIAARFRGVARDGEGLESEDAARAAAPASCRSFLSGAAAGFVFFPVGAAVGHGGAHQGGDGVCGGRRPAT
eukprot:509763-Alexandrium_andersonii.AAC.1